MKFKRFLTIVIVLLILISGFLIWRNYRNIASIKYTTQKAQYGDVVQSVSANGTLNPVVLVNVGTQISGLVEKIYADYNDKVKEGQVLLELDKTLLLTDIAQSTAQVKKAKTALDLAKANESRGLPLRKLNFLSKQDFEQLAQIRKSAESDLSLAEAQRKKAQTNLGYATIYSPVSGIIVDRSVDVGQTVAASFQTPVLFKIAQDLSKMQIDSSFAEADIGNIRPGQIANFTVDAFPDRNFTGIVKQIRLNPTVQQNVVTYDVVIEVNNKDGVLLPGMTAYVNIAVLDHKNVLMVPNAALRYQPKNQTGKNNSNKQQATNTKRIYKLSEKAIPLDCRVGISNSQFTEISSCPLKAGDEVITGEEQQGQTSTGSSLRVRVF